ncbi:MAG: hypothetical protein ACRCT8_00280 [Lacipirellulaceae bacterium]
MLFAHATDDTDDTTLDDGTALAALGPPPRLELPLVIADADVIRDLWPLAEGEERNRYALDALRIGVLALRNAGSRVDADRLKDVGDHLLKQMESALKTNVQSLGERTESVLRQYFDPKDGRLAERLQRLMADDGELATLLRGQLHGEASPLAAMLGSRLGPDSPLMKQLDPQQTGGLLARLQKCVEEELAKQRDRILDQFTLDKPDSALRRLVDELTGKHGDLSKDLRGKIDEVSKQFSLDHEDSALARLVGRVRESQQTITAEFSLDNDQSALARLRDHLGTILSAHVDSNQKFQEEVKVALASLTTRREAAARGTEHGVVFEESVGAFLQADAHGRGDVLDATGATTGAISGRKYGDFVVALGPDTAAPGARIVVEAKDEKGYSLVAAIEELGQARKNRHADFGVFVMATASARGDFPRFRRYGADLVVQWDAADPATDPYLTAAIEVARACVIEFRRDRTSDAVDVEAIEKAINSVEKQCEGLDQVEKPAQTIRSSAEKILERVRIDRDALTRQVAVLRKQTAALGSLGDGAS